jgi:hypothetical protein
MGRWPHYVERSDAACQRSAAPNHPIEKELDQLVALKLALALAAFVFAIRYPGLLAPAAIALGLWFGMVGLARVHPRLATLLYCAHCGALGYRPWRW